MNLMIPEITIEECAEVIQAITKIQRFGMENTGYDNKMALEIEIGQLQYMLDCLRKYWDLSPYMISNAYDEKKKALVKYAKYNTCNQNLAGT